MSAGLLAALVALAAYRGIRLLSEAHRATGRADDLALAPGWAILADDPPAGTVILATPAGGGRPELPGRDLGAAARPEAD